MGTLHDAVAGQGPLATLGKLYPTEDPDNPIWTEEDFARARPADEVMPAAVLAALVKKS